MFSSSKELTFSSYRRSQRYSTLQLSSVSHCDTRAILQHASLSLLILAAHLGFQRVWCSAAWPLHLCDLRWSQPAEIQPQAETEVCCRPGCSELEMGRSWINADGEALWEQQDSGGKMGLVSSLVSDLCQEVLLSSKYWPHRQENNYYWKDTSERYLQAKKKLVESSFV